jgi:hypothetical protein
MFGEEDVIFTGVAGTLMVKNERIKRPKRAKRLAR